MARAWEIIRMGIWSKLALTDGRIYFAKAFHSFNHISLAFLSACWSWRSIEPSCALITENLLHSFLVSCPYMSIVFFKLWMVFSMILNLPLEPLPPVPTRCKFGGSMLSSSRFSSSPLQVLSEGIEFQLKLRSELALLGRSSPNLGSRIHDSGSYCESVEVRPRAIYFPLSLIEVCLITSWSGCGSLLGLWFWCENLPSYSLFCLRLFSDLGLSLVSLGHLFTRQYKPFSHMLQLFCQTFDVIHHGIGIPFCMLEF